LNILFISFWYPTANTPLKGLFIREHARAIHCANANILVLAVDVSYGPKVYEKKINLYIDEEGLKTHVIQIKSLFHKWIYINPFFLYFIVKKYFINKIAPVFNPDIVHSNVLNPCALIGDWLSKKINKPHIITEHWSKVEKYMKKNIFSLLGKKAYNRAAAVTTVSYFLKENISKYFLNSQKITVVPNVVDLNLFYYSPKNRSKNELIFTAVAHWQHPKAPTFFIEALNKIQEKSQQKIILNIIGEGILLNNIKKAKHLFTINFWGNLKKSEIAYHLQQSDYFLHASYIETFSIVIAEALATGTPVVASKVGAIPELINDSNGVLCENTKEDWIKGIEIAIAKTFINSKIGQGVQNKYDSLTIGNTFKKIYHTIK
jgi:glycosyltransferase involved in cell wall biosynthesis